MPGNLSLLQKRGQKHLLMNTGEQTNAPKKSAGDFQLGSLHNPKDAISPPPIR
jgi:hypothetical protein